MPPVADKLIEPPTHVLVADAVADTVVTETFVEAVVEQPLALVTVTVYVPALAVVAESTEGVAELDVKLLGPDHE